MYAHRLHSGFYHNVNKPEQFGFAKSQVTPFNVSTPDGETLYAWHILPLNAVAKHKDDLFWHAIKAGKRDVPDSPTLHSLPLKILQSDPDAKVVVNCTSQYLFFLSIHHLLPSLIRPSISDLANAVHGNAGHVAQGWRTDTYRSLISQPNTHVFTIDYRGFGLSTGSPTEAGLITDGVALVTWILTHTSIPASRIVLLGQSLGTAVASAVSLHFATLGTGSPSQHMPLLPAGEVTDPQVFAGIVLVAPFTSLPSLLQSYRIGGVLPVLAPLKQYPRVLKAFTDRIADRWPSANRLRAYVEAVGTLPAFVAAGAEGGGRGAREIGSLSILHAQNDGDISFHQSEALFARAVGAEGTWMGTSGASWKIDGSPRVTLEILEFGGELCFVSLSVFFRSFRSSPPLFFLCHRFLFPFFFSSLLFRKIPQMREYWSAQADLFRTQQVTTASSRTRLSHWPSCVLSGINK